LQPIVRALRPLARRFRVSNGDILHVAGILAVGICPGGPQIETWIGRREARNVAPRGLLPNVNDAVPKIVARFYDLNLTVTDLIALIGAHTTATQQFVDPARAGESQDSTPDIWDVKFYGETFNRTTPEGVFKFASDVRMAHHPITTAQFQDFIDEQDDWDKAYAIAHAKMSILGQNKKYLTLCTEILPPHIDLGDLFIDKDGDNGAAHAEVPVGAGPVVPDVPNPADPPVVPAQ